VGFKPYKAGEVVFKHFQALKSIFESFSYLILALGNCQAIRKCLKMFKNAFRWVKMGFKPYKAGEIIFKHFCAFKSIFESFSYIILALGNCRTIQKCLKMPKNALKWVKVGF
jgi:hypothetical protein